MGKRLWAGRLVIVASVALAYACLKLYDEPVRAWLKERVLKAKKTSHPAEEPEPARKA